jgi:ABC-type dipeptide/oligopeptide/nickel transport system permease component
MSAIALRVFSFLGVVWIAATITFLALRVLPGDAIEAQLLQSGVSQVVIEERRNQQGLNDAIIVQYSRYIFQLIKGDLGYSLLDGQSVNEMIAAQILPTLTLAIAGIFIAILVGIPLGIFTAIDVGYGLRSICNLLITLSLSLPIYWTGTLVTLVFSVHLRLLPAVGAGNLSQLILPASVLGFYSSGAIARVIQTSINEVSTADFVRTAHAKGLPKHLVVRRHILRASLLPAITVIMVQMGFLLGGTVITESLFVRPGIGRLLLDRTLKQDYPVVQGIIVLAAVVYSLLNNLADFFYRLIDPRMSVT